jgi:ABC-type uncharacterized transport system auxiliary subunit
MVRELAAVAAIVFGLTGCSSTTSVPADTTILTAQQCTRGGGWWRVSLGVCDMQGTGVQR